MGKERGRLSEREKDIGSERWKGERERERERILRWDRKRNERKKEKMNKNREGKK